jgi:hypothetical protein
MSDSQTRRRYRQFSLRTFLVVLTLVCLWFGWQVNRASRQRQAVAWVLEMGGSVKCDDGATIADAKSMRHFHGQVAVIQFIDTQFHDLAPLASLKSLRELCLPNTQVSDLTPLANLKGLELLHIVDTQASEEQIKRLQQALPNCTIRNTMPRWWRRLFSNE